MVSEVTMAQVSTIVSHYFRQVNISLNCCKCNYYVIEFYHFLPFLWLSQAVSSVNLYCCVLCVLYKLGESAKRWFAYLGFGSLHTNG